MAYQIGLIGSTQYTLTCAQALLHNRQFNVSWVLTPSAKPQGRNQRLIPNPVQNWADRQKVTSVLINSIINKSTQEQLQTIILSNGRPDFLLVVDFGYLIPKWLIDLPNIKSLNIHPSDLPRWRGSSPAQFVLLYGEKITAVCLITLTEKFDQGDIVFKLPLSVNPDWTQTEYYQTCFSQISHYLPDIFDKLANQQITPLGQIPASPTQTARRISKDDSFIDWQNVMQARAGKETIVKPLSPLLNSVLAHLKKTNDNSSRPALLLCQLIEQATRAFSPWPYLWTFVPTKTGQKRMKILHTSLDDLGQLKLESVQIEGHQPTSINQVKNIIQL